ncbi:thiamine phosphate synthase [Massilia endophytica]|uniref:thiamine phosphate synthase n=1 Tax=Massilia endophytica TaxID=2899220 RepID=UPI001E59CFAC|nr:thiamine phosphate synthase [Massilia endophytica]UGQ47096.1 thiamine phosphate synthase [Massilia endophytica]
MQGLYLVTPDWDDTAALLERSEQALRAGVALLQYRHKTADEALRRSQAGALLELCRRHGTPLVINDHIALCQELDADGVHVGGTDASVDEARAALGAHKIVGASCYGELERAIAAQRAGASYAAFGGFYPSRVKRYDFVTSPEILDRARVMLRVPCVVIGGMTPENARPLVARGAQMVAAISSVYGAPDTAQAVEAFRGLFHSR